MVLPLGSENAADELQASGDGFHYSHLTEGQEKPMHQGI